MSRKYLQRIIFGLGTSRHHASALKWSGSYPLWLLYGSLYSFGMLIMGFNDALFSKRRAAGWRVAFASYLGWCAGMVAMSRMEAKKRKKLLGAAVHQSDSSSL